MTPPSKPTELMKFKSGTDGSSSDGTRTADCEPGKTRAEKVLSKVAVMESKKRTSHANI